MQARGLSAPHSHRWQDFHGGLDGPWVEALAIRGDRIAAVGTTAEVRRLAGRGAREIALVDRATLGKLADLAVLSQDVFTIPAEALRE
jgi:predicted amidohydrolase YtcJ